MELEREIATVREFNREYTRFAGVMDGKCLPKGYSLPELHTMFEIARHPGTNAKELCRTLRMDAGYLSRILSGLAKRRFLKRTRSMQDKRLVHLELSSVGENHQRQHEAFANAHVKQMLEQLTPFKRATMIRAMRAILPIIHESASAPIIIRPMKLGDAGWIAHRHGAVIAPEFGWNEQFEALCARILADFIDSYQPEWERSFIAERNGEVLGSLFLVRQDAETAKLRLLYVEPAARGMGLASKLLEKSIQFARSKSYARVTLFTTSNNLNARRLYDKLGFRLVREEVQDFCGQPLTEEHWELVL